MGIFFKKYQSLMNGTDLPLSLTDQFIRVYMLGKKSRATNVSSIIIDIGSLEHNHHGSYNVVELSLPDGVSYNCTFPFTHNGVVYNGCKQNIGCPTVNRSEFLNCDKTGNNNFHS